MTKWTVADAEHLAGRSSRRVKVLIDENLPRKLVEALRAEGHEAESVHTLYRQDVDNGRLAWPVWITIAVYKSGDLNRSENFVCEIPGN